MSTIADLTTKCPPTWCPGCGDFMVLAGLKKALVQLNWSTHQTVIVYDIGCVGNMADFIKTYAIHTLHGRAVPIAMGIRYHQPNLNIIVLIGDGGAYGEGLNHLITAARANIGIKVLVCDNQLYSLTTGQTSPTTPHGIKTKSTPQGNQLIPLNPVSLIKSINPAVWVDQSSTRQPLDLNPKIVAALQSPAFSLLNIDQECVTYGDILKP